MSGGRERIDPAIVRAVEQSAYHRIMSESDKELIEKHKISRASIHRIIRAAKQRIMASMKQ